MRPRVLLASDPGPHDARLSLRIGPSNDRPQRVGVRSYSHSCAVTTSSAAQCSGHNFHGELGDGTTNNPSTPVTVVGPP